MLAYSKNNFAIISVLQFFEKIYFNLGIIVNYAGKYSKEYSNSNKNFLSNIIIQTENCYLSEG